MQVPDPPHGQARYSTVLNSSVVMEGWTKDENSDGRFSLHNNLSFYPDYKSGLVLHLILTIFTAAAHLIMSAVKAILYLLIRSWQSFVLERLDPFRMIESRCGTLTPKAVLLRAQVEGLGGPGESALGSKVPTQDPGWARHGRNE